MPSLQDMFMKASRRRSVQAVALCLAGLYVLASGRGLIPGICATLSSVEACENPVLVQSSAQSCCESSGDSSPAGRNTSGDAAPKCGLCKLAHAAASLSYHAPSVGIEAISYYAANHKDDCPQSSHTWNPASLRGPPALLS